MTKTAQVIMPKMCHERFPPSAKIDNTGKATKGGRESSLSVEIPLDEPPFPR
jgi:hypothetical protein